MKYVFYLILLFLLVAPFTSSQSSDEVSFTLPGCTLLSQEKVARNHCSADGRYFCDSSDKVFSSMSGSNAFYACKGSDGKIGGTDCCPAGMQCSVAGCVLQTTPCESYKTSADCETQGGCAWINNGREEVCRNRNALSCSDYRSSASCLADSMYLGKNGLGTEKCRVAAYVGTKLVTNCRCGWNTTGTGRCFLTYNISETLFLDNPLGFSCEKIFQVDDCISGEQKVNWTAMPVINAGFSPNSTDISQAGCENGTKTLACGENLIKLPFFSWINFILVMLAISIIYAISMRKH